MDILEKLHLDIDDKQWVIGIYLDLSKACYTVDHQYLLEKLNCYGIRGNVNKWFQSYLSDRNQFVQINGKNLCLKISN